MARHYARWEQRPKWMSEDSISTKYNSAGLNTNLLFHSVFEATFKSATFGDLDDTHWFPIFSGLDSIADIPSRVQVAGTRHVQTVYYILTGWAWAHCTILSIWARLRWCSYGVPNV